MTSNKNKLKNCILCNKEFEYKSAKAIYCSKYCNHLAYRKRHPDKLNKRRNDWYANSKEEQKAYRRDHMKEYNKKYWTKRRAEDPIFRMKSIFRTRLGDIVRNGGRRSSLKDLLGCTDQEFRNHLESKFQNGMTWENYGKGGWHIDHIKPCDAFDLNDPIQQAECWHYSNLQPLWEIDNLKKGNKYD